jgi:DNA-binding IclR family transcriptional regulator
MRSKTPRSAASAPAERPRYDAPALEKGLDILELLAGHPDGLTQAQIAKALGRSVSEIFRMIDCLLRRRYVTLRRPGDTYALSLKLFELSHRHPPTRRLIDQALPLMKEVAKRLDQSCHLCVYHDGRVMVAAQVDNPGSLGFLVRMGALLDLLHTSSGRVILAFSDEAEKRKMLDEYQAVTGSRVDLKALEQQLATVRRKGYDEADSEQAVGVRNVSFPVISFSGEAVATLAVPYLRRLDGNRADLADTQAALREAATRLAVALGAAAVQRNPGARPGSD